MEITNNYHQYAAHHKCLRQYGGIGVQLTLQGSIRT